MDITLDPDTSQANDQEAVAQTHHHQRHFGHSDFQLEVPLPSETTNLLSTLTNITLDPPKVFPFEALPAELQLRVVQFMEDEAELMRFRLVSTLTNTLVLEPYFWQELIFSKQRHFKTGHHPSRPPRARRSSLDLSISAPYPLEQGIGQGVGPHSSRGSGQPQSQSYLPLFYHQSDADFVVHRQSWAASVMTISQQHQHELQTVASRLVHHPSLSITTGRVNAGDTARAEHLDRLSSSLESPTALGDDIACPWAQKEDSFKDFISALLQRLRSAKGVQKVAIEDWSNRGTIFLLWQHLRRLTRLEELSLRRCVLERLIQPTAVLGVERAEPLQSPWEHLLRLDLKECHQLRDISGIHWLMPSLKEISLEGCLGLVDFSPLSVSTPRPLSLTVINLTNTKVRDDQLLAILQQSAQLRELRLDQCYDLTSYFLVAIGKGKQKSDRSGVGPPGVDDVVTHGSSNGVSHSMTDLSGVAAHEEGEESAEGGLSGLVSNGESNEQAPAVHNGLDKFRSYCPSLKILSVKNCCDLSDEGIRALAGCRRLELLIIRGLRQVDEQTVEWLHSQGVPLRKVLSPLGRWRHWQA